VTGVQPAGNKRPALAVLMGRGNLLLRIVSSLLLAPIAIAAAYFGGMIFMAFWALAALAVLWEWDTLVCADERNAVLATGAVAIAGAALLMAIGRSGVAMALIALGFFAVAVLSSRLRRVWCAAGLVYAAALLIAPVLLRHDAGSGFAAIIFLFAVVWLTDIAAYFAGRGIGGPKLMARVSPNKTWSGAIGGTLAGVLGGVAVARGFGIAELASVAVVALLLSVVSQAGDLVESAIKRHFNAKDASQLIPGHGGLMDRLDGFVAAAAVGAVIGIAHGGFDAPARGLMVW
jgi:phosphatidate cytidylyltransferase